MKVSEWIKNLTEIQNRSELDKFSDEELTSSWMKVRFLVWEKIKLIGDMEAVEPLTQITKSLSIVEPDNHSHIPHEKRVIIHHTTGDRYFAKKNKQIWDYPYRFFDLVVQHLPKKKYKFLTKKTSPKKKYDLEFLELLAQDLNENINTCKEYIDIYKEIGIYEEEKKKLYIKYGMEYIIEEELSQIELVDISSIKEHPINREIYSSSRKNEDEELEENIKLYGLLQPIVVDEKTNFIISGNRRFNACKNIGLKKVKVIKTPFQYDVISLINFNKYRTKTTIEKVNEYRMMKTQIKKMGYNDRKKLMGGIGMRDYIFQQTGVSQKTEHQLSVVESKNPKLAEMVLTGEISIKKAYLEVNKKPKTLTSDVKDKLDELKKLITYDLFPYLGKSKILQIIDWIYDDKPSLYQQTSIRNTNDRWKSMLIRLFEHYGLNDDGKYSENDLDFYTSFIFNLQRENPKHEQLMGEFFFKLFEEKARENGWKIGDTNYEVFSKEFGGGNKFSESKYDNWRPSEKELEERKKDDEEYINEDGFSEFSTRILEKKTWKERFGDKSLEDFIKEDE